MTEIRDGRFTAQIEGDFAVFIIGMRVYRLWMFHKWLPITRVMPRMLKELFANKDMGLLHVEPSLSGRTVMILQYWRSFEQLHACAHARELEHLPAWAEFNRRVSRNGSVGIFHESYLVRAREYESVYVNMPQFGLAAAGTTEPAIGRYQSAKARLNHAGASTEPEPTSPAALGSR